MLALPKPTVTVSGFNFFPDFPMSMMHGSNWFIYQCQSILNIHKYFLNRKNYSVHFLLRRNRRTWDTRLRSRSWRTKMLRKMHVVCLILEYFPLKPGSLKILPPLLQKNKVEVWPEHFCSRLNNIDLGGVRGGVTMVPNSRGGSPVSKKVQNF